MCASALGYQPDPDRNEASRERIVVLAHRYRRYGAGMNYLKLRQAGEQVNHKRLEHLYAAGRLELKRRKREEIPMALLKPLGLPSATNQVWSMDVVFDCTAEGLATKNLTVVDDGTHEEVAIVPERHWCTGVNADSGPSDSTAWAN